MAKVLDQPRLQLHQWVELQRAISSFWSQTHETLLQHWLFPKRAGKLGLRKSLPAQQMPLGGYSGRVSTAPGQPIQAYHFLATRQLLRFPCMCSDQHQVLTHGQLMSHRTSEVLQTLP